MRTLRQRDTNRLHSAHCSCCSDRRPRSRLASAVLGFILLAGASLVAAHLLGWQL